MFHLTRENLTDFKKNIRREWAITNGIGGYAGGSVTGACCRTHQGYLIASLHPPVERYMVFSKTNETFFCGEETFCLEVSQHAGEAMGSAGIDSRDVPEEYLREDTVNVAADFKLRRPIYREGQRYLTGFDYDGTVSFDYQAGDIRMRKQLALVRGKNTIAIAYTVENDGEEAGLSITPLMNYREHSQASTRESLKFETVPNSFGGFDLIPADAPQIRISLSCSDGELVEREERFDEDVQYQIEVDNETPGLDTHFCPYDIRISIPAHSIKKISLLCTVTAEGGENCDCEPSDHDRNGTLYSDRPENQTAHQIVGQVQNYYEGLIQKAGFGDDWFASALVTAADQFLVYRSSTQLMTVLAGLPWFTDWGRDTMIAFSGLTLATGRFAEAREILTTFAKYVSHGLVPNMFPDNGQDPLYNTADASLWYFYAVDAYLKATGGEEDFAFVKEQIYPALCEIIRAYEEGTDFSIYMDTDGLIHAGSGNDQVTWMDVRVGDWVVTPRHGKPVEINALWYNALCVMEKLSGTFGEDSSHYRTLSKQVAESFCSQFWNLDRCCLYDVVDGEKKDDSIRPNQIYAVSLPYTMLPENQAAAVVETVEKQLLAGPGIRSLSPEHPDYHGIYCGSLPKRDAAYHQGTAWGYLMGGFITAYLKVHDYSIEAKRQALDFLEPVKQHLYEGCIGSISEIFDGDEPHNCRGCYAQAWSVGEILRCYQDCMK